MKKRNQILTKPTRRQFLGMVGSAGLGYLATSPLNVLLTSLVDGVLAKAQAQSATVPARNFVFLNLGGGPARWVWDMPLMPYRVESMMPNAHVKTRFRSSTEAEYATTAVTRNGVTLNMPSLWNAAIPTASGGTAPMANLLDNMLMIRGIKLPSDGHVNNNYKILRPVTSSVSLNGAVADRSRTAVPAVALPGAYKDSYLSAKSISQASIENTYNDPIRQLLGPFDQASDGISAGSDGQNRAMDAALNTALNDLAAQSKLSVPGSENLYSMRTEAIDLLRKGIGDLSSTYNSLLNKYRNLIQRVGAADIPGVTDVAVSLGSLPRKNGVILHSITENAAECLGPNADIRQFIQGDTTVPGLAENFAIAEYLLINGYSSAINMGCGSVYGLHVQDGIQIGRDANGAVTATGSTGNHIGGWGFDEHEGGSFTSMVVNSFLYTAISACLYEFISQLKTANLFNETVIQIGGEFSRSARNDNSGSDHGWTAHTTSLFSGAITKPAVLGNTLYTTPSWYPNNQYPGSWGFAAPVQVDGVSQELTIGHSTSTVAHLLRVEAPLPNNGSLVTDSATGVVPTVELAKNSNG